MKNTKKILAAAAFGLAGLMAIPASAQYYPSGNNGGWHQDRDHDGDRDRDDRDRDREGDRDGRRRDGNWGWQNDNGNYGRNGNYSRDSENRAYQAGYNDGIFDRQHGPQQRQRAWQHD
jgi:hypothetical protein